jgi:serine/threonine protein kinase
VRPGLLFESSNGASRFWLTSEREVIIGRRPPWGSPNVRVSSVMASRQHARITSHADGFMVEDAGSCGGLSVDDERVQGPVPLGPGMRLQLCSEIVYTLRTLTAEPLWDRLDGKPMPTAIALLLAEQSLRALLPVHEAGRYHGDLTPREILCAEDGSIVLLLPGWAETNTEIRGNPVYTAPETITEDRIEPATDIYVLGLILFEALSGYRPFSSGPGVIAHVAQKLTGSLTWPPDLSPALQAWLASLLAIDPAQRPSAREALDRLPHVGLPG